MGTSTPPSCSIQPMRGWDEAAKTFAQLRQPSEVKVNWCKSSKEWDLAGKRSLSPGCWEDGKTGLGGKTFDTNTNCHMATIYIHILPSGHNIQTHIATWPQHTKTNFIYLLIHAQVGGTVTGEHGVGLGKVGTFSCKHKMLSTWQGCSSGRAVWRGGGWRDEKCQKSFGPKVF